jgi:hypothetical protein
MRPAPASVGRRATIFDDNLLIWRPFFDFGMASIISLMPSGLFPAARLHAAVFGIDASAVTEDLIAFFMYLFRVLRAFLQDHVVISFFFWVLL